MSKSVRSLDRITVASPCDADWELMIGNDQVRFCEHCHLHVTNLSSMTRREAMRFVERSRGRLCVRYVERANGEVLTKQLPQKLYGIGRRASRLAAGAFSATLSVASAAAQARTADHQLTGRLLPVPAAAAPATQGASVSGVIKDPNGAVIPGATVSLINPKDNTLFVFVTSDDGAYNFSLLDAGPYNLSVNAPGFSVMEKKDLNLAAAPSQTVDVDLTLPILIAEVEVIANPVIFESSIQGSIGIREPSDPLVKAAFKNDLSAVKQLVAVTDDVNRWDQFTNTNALSYAIEHHNLEMVDLLLAVGAGINISNKYGKTPLMFLNADATVELVHRLLGAGAGVNAHDESEVTVLHQAARACGVAVVRELIANGARIDTKDDHGNTVLMSAAVNDDAGVVKLLVTAGANVSAKNESGECALSIAAQTGSSQSLKAIIDAGGALNLNQEQLNQVLIESASVDDSRVVKILIDAGANPNATDEDGSTALIEAAGHGTAETLSVLIAAGADLNARDHDGCTALMEAGEIEKVRLLLNAGADLSVTNKDGQTALRLAIENQLEEIVQLLKSRGAPN